LMEIHSPEKDFKDRVTRCRVSLLAFFVLLLFVCVCGCGVPVKHIGALLDAGLDGHNYRAGYEGAVLDIPYAGRDNDMLKLDVFRVKGGEPAPVLVFIHGGYWNSGHRKLYASFAKTFNSAGFVTVLVDYRLFPEVMYPVFVDDCVNALNWTMEHIAEYGGDPERIFVAGSSAGSHIAAMILLDDEFRNSLAFDPMKIRGALLTSSPFDFEKDNLLDEDILHEVMGSEENYNDAQPIKHIRKDVPPILIINGDRDPLTSEAQAARFAHKMKEIGAPVTYLMIPGGDHHSVGLGLTPGRKDEVFAAFMKFARDAGAFPNK
jgi:acetyl esterase/lipase